MEDHLDTGFCVLQIQEWQHIHLIFIYFFFISETKAGELQTILEEPVLVSVQWALTAKLVQ